MHVEEAGEFAASCARLGEHCSSVFRFAILPAWKGNSWPVRSQGIRIVFLVYGVVKRNESVEKQIFY